MLWGASIKCCEEECFSDGRKRDLFEVGWYQGLRVQINVRHVVMKPSADSIKGVMNN